MKTLTLNIVGREVDVKVMLEDVSDINFDPNHNEHDIAVTMDDGTVHFCDQMIIEKE